MDVAGLMSRGCSSEAVVGIGVSESVFHATAARLLERACAVRLERFDSPKMLVDALLEGRVDAAVRGALPSSEAISRLKDSFGLDGVMRVAIMADRTGRPFMLAPVGIDEGRDVSERKAIVISAVEYFAKVGWVPAIGVLSKGRNEDEGRGESIRLSLKDGEALTAELVSRGLDARHYAILVERAATERDLVVAPDGVTGNLMFRTLHLVGGCEAYGAPVVNMRRVFVDTTRAKADFSDAVMLAAGLSQHIH